MFNSYIRIRETLQKKAMSLFKKYYVPRWMVFTFDIATVFLAFFFAYMLRFNMVISDFSINLAIQQALITICVYSLFEFIFRPYTGLIRHTTVIDIFNVFMATSCSMVILLLLSLTGRQIGLSEIVLIPISIIMIHYVLITVLLFFVRLVIKIFYQFITSSFIEKKKVLIFGAGAMGVIVKRVIQSDVKGIYQIAGFLDNNKKLQGKKLNGIPVYNPKIIFTDFPKKQRIETLIFAIKDISPSEKSDIINSALEVGIEVRDTPPVESWLNGELQIRQIQKVQLKDLLGRDPIILNLKKIGTGLRDKTILITGAAGSIGSEIVRQLTRFSVKDLILVDQAETPMFTLENEIKNKYTHIHTHIIIADITNHEKMESIFHELKPTIVFHAAAYKHVPLMEINPHAAVRVNVGGTHVITNLAIKYNVKKFVMISTDKAVNPTNVMGATKKLCEMILHIKSNQPDNNTQFVITRFGNVLGSNGSVIPIFSKQIEEGGPVTVTHPEISRYFMTIPEACQLVLEAGFMGKGNEIYVFDMGKPIKIANLAYQMIRLSGFIPEKDIKIKFTGLRPGEKLYEELLADKEETLPTHHPKIMIARIKNLDYSKLSSIIEKLLKELYSMSKQQVIQFLSDVVPEYKINKEELKDMQMENRSVNFEQ